MVYHFKGHKETDQFWRDIPLNKFEFNVKPIQPTEVRDWLYKSHAYYFEDTCVKKEQVVWLMKKLIDKLAEIQKQNWIKK